MLSPWTPSVKSKFDMHQCFSPFSATCLTKGFIILAILFVMTSLSFGSDLAFDAHGEEASIPTNEAVCTFHTSVGELVIEKKDAYSKISLSIHGKNMGGVNSFFWKAPRLGEALSIESTMTDEQVIAAITLAGLAPQSTVSSSDD